MSQLFSDNITLTCIQANACDCFVGPDVESPSSSSASCIGSGAEGLLAEPEDKELYLMCLCEQPVTSVDGSKKKKGKEIVIGFLVS